MHQPAGVPACHAEIWSAIQVIPCWQLCCQKLVCKKTESPPVATHALQVEEQVLFQKCVKGGQPGKWSSQIGIPLHNFTGGASTS